MNISQHCFVPRGEVLQDKYYSLGGQLLPSTVGVATTEKQIGDIYNCFQLFGSYVPNNASWYALRLFGSPTGQHQQNYVGLGTTISDGYVSPTLVKKPDVYTSSAFTFKPTSYGFMVSSVMWLEDNPSVPRLNIINSIDNQEEIK